MTTGSGTGMEQGDFDELAKFLREMAGRFGDTKVWLIFMFRAPLTCP